MIEEEVLEIEKTTTEASGSDRARMPLLPLLTELVEKGLLEELDIGSPEEEPELVQFAADLDDGEAHTCTLAIVRAGRVATDNKTAIGILRAAWEAQGEKREPILDRRRRGVPSTVLKVQRQFPSWQTLRPPRTATRGSTKRPPGRNDLALRPFDAPTEKGAR